MTDYPISPSMASALRLLRAHPEGYERQTDQTWRPATPTPGHIISRNTMETLIRRGHVIITKAGPRGTPHAVVARQGQPA